MRKEFYEHSGVVPPKAIALALVAMLIAGPIAGALYALAIWYNPFIYVSMVLSLAFGAGMAFLVTSAMRAGNSRSTVASILMGVLGAAFAHAVGWFTWIGLAFSSDEEFKWTYLLDPEAFVGALFYLNEVGVWSLRNNTATGGFLWFVWGVELLFVLGAGAFVALVVASEGVFCEGCKAWCEESEGDLRFSTTDEEARLVSRLEAGGLEALEALQPPSLESNEWLAASLHECKSCEKTRTFTLNHVTRTFDKDGDPKLANETLVDHLRITREQADKVRALGSRAAQVLEGEDDAIAAAS